MTLPVQITTIAAVAVLAVLLVGLWNMGRPNSSPSLSQKLMRWRVALQFLAIIIALIALALTRGVG